MLIFIYFFAIVLLSFYSLFVNRQKSEWILLFLCFFTFILTGIRWEYGGDWDVYLSYFRSIVDWDFQVPFEYGWVIFSTIIKYVSDSYIIFQFLIASFIFYAVYHYIKELSPLPLISYMVYFSTTAADIGYVRSSVAVVIVLYSLVFVVKKSKLKFVLCILFASSLHLSALAGFVLYPVFYCKIRYKYILLFFIINTLLFLKVGPMVFQSMSFLGDVLYAKIQTYMEASEAGETFGSTITTERAIIGHLIKKVFVLVFVLMYMRDVLKTDITFRGLFNVYIFSSIFYCAVFPVIREAAMRMCGYFECVDMLIFAYILSNLKLLHNKIIFFILLCLFSFFRLNGLVSGSTFHSNYNSILTQMY